MKINFTKKQYEALLKAAYLGIWMASASNETPEKNSIDEIGRYLFSFGKDLGLDKYVEHDEENNVFYPSRIFEEDAGLNELIDTYDDNAFLTKLIENLAGRDMLNKYGEDAIMNMTDEEFIKKERSFLDKYEDEFAKNGLKNLKVAT